MRISGYTYVRNGLKYDYPFLESIQSVLPIVDEFIVVLGDSTDGSREALQNLKSDKIKIIDTVWDMNLRAGGKLFAQQSTIGAEAATGDWVLHVQADEVIHEKDILKLKEYIVGHDKNKKVDGLLLPFLNFRGDFQHIQTGRRVHRFEVRAFRNTGLVYAYKDSQGFRKYSSKEAYVNGEVGEKLNVIKTDIPVYHYSFVRPPEKMKEKAAFFTQFFFEENDPRLQVAMKKVEEFDYNEIDKLEFFPGTHPNVMSEIISRKDWAFEYDPTKCKSPLRHKILNKIEAWTGYRIGEYKNYKLI